MLRKFLIVSCLLSTYGYASMKQEVEPSIERNKADQEAFKKIEEQAALERLKHVKEDIERCRASMRFHAPVAAVGGVVTFVLAEAALRLARHARMLSARMAMVTAIGSAVMFSPSFIATLMTRNALQELRSIDAQAATNNDPSIAK